MSLYFKIYSFQINFEIDFNFYADSYAIWWDQLQLRRNLDGGGQFIKLAPSPSPQPRIIQENNDESLSN